MTRKEAIGLVKSAFDAWEYNYDTGDDWSREHEARDMAIKALNQEPCDDAISRQAVLEYIEGNEADLWHSSENELVCQDIKALPPVTPQQKNGKWLKGNSYGDQYNYYQSCVCSYCKREYDVHGWKYCPNCGAKMEVEE